MAKPMLPRSSVIVLMIVALCGTGEARQRLQEIKKRGHLVCGISPGFAGFARRNDRGGYTGFDVDICRAIATAMLGKPDQLQLRDAPSIQQFLQSPDIDVVSRRLSWTLERETSFEALFGPVVFYDGQGFLGASSRPRCDYSGASAGRRRGVSPDDRGAQPRPAEADL